MGSSTTHDNVAKRIAKKFGVEYNKGKGPDVSTENEVIEVETADTVKDGLRQLRGFQKEVYIAGANKEVVEAALEATKDTTIGVMDKKCKILKPSTRKTRRKKRKR